MIVIDGFLDDYDDFRAHCDNLQYGDVENPEDGVSYPGISLDIPDAIKREILAKAQAVMKKTISRDVTFLRLSKKGVKAPHQAHTDALMGDIGLFLYMGSDGGTSFVKHKETGMEYNPDSQEETAIWARDTNNYEAWDVLEYIGMKPNRALVFDARRMHRAEPPGGYGDSSSNGRLALISFLTVNDDKSSETH